MMTKETYDTIVIGAGAGGLMAALLLARKGQRVLLCEQHEVPGGWMHSFSMDGYRFNTGVHYIGELGEGERFYALYDQLGILNDVEFISMNPDGYDHVLIDENRFDIPKGGEAYINRLQQRFPAEKEGIAALFVKIRQIDDVLKCMMHDQWFHVLKHPTALPWLTRSGQALIDSYVRDPMLRAILLSQAGNHGMPPGQVSAAVQASIMQHYLSGGYHPKGGGMAIARAFVRAFKKSGGEIRLSTAVDQILLENKTVTGVKLKNGELVASRHVISNADPETTFVRLMGTDDISSSLRKKLAKTSYSTSCLSLYLVLNADLHALGFDSGNYWLFDSTDIDLHCQQGLTDYNAYHEPSMLFVTATSIKDPSKMHAGYHQMEVFALCGYDAFAKWAHEPQGARSQAYQDFKSAIMERMLSAVGKRFPALPGSVVWKELGTPLSNVHYIQGHRGNMYGIDKRIWQAGPLGYTTSTEFKHLYLCGASTMAHGVAYASATGINAAARVLKVPVTSLWMNP